MPLAKHRSHSLDADSGSLRRQHRATAKTMKHSSLRPWQRRKQQRRPPSRSTATDDRARPPGQTLQEPPTQDGEQREETDLPDDPAERQLGVLPRAVTARRWIRWIVWISRGVHLRVLRRGRSEWRQRQQGPGSAQAWPVLVTTMLGGSPAQQPTAAAQSDGEGRAATATQQRTAAAQGVGNDREGPRSAQACSRRPCRSRHPPTSSASSGRKRLDDRKVLCGMLHTGIRCEFLPQELGSGSGITCWRRLAEWHRAGMWDRLHRLLLEEPHTAGRL
ncbi:transposase [Actinomadura welshii]|uniref:transposase n=1 Tax=Actinomadura welshii TaxID=3103817 RepID=UPI003B8A88B2